MNAINCKPVRREIDELNPDRQLSSETIQHLDLCSECRRFHEEQRALLGLLASLEAANAPPDFDFRLRARLASQENIPGPLNISLFRTGIRPLAAAALVLLIVVAGIEVKSRLSNLDSHSTNSVPTRSYQSLVKQNDAVRSPGPTANSEQGTMTPSGNDEVRRNSAGTGQRGAANRARRLAASEALAKNTQPRATRDSALGPAPVFTPNKSPDSGPMLIVPLNAHALKLSVDYGRGRARTIFFPTVSFGSQRVLERSASFAPVSPSKGAW